MSKEKELFHNGARCPACGERAGVPDLPVNVDPCAVPMGYDFDRDGHECGLLRCAGCGHDWVENHAGEIARAWFAHGAHTQFLRQLAADETVQRIVAWYHRRAEEMTAKSERCDTRGEQLQYLLLSMSLKDEADRIEAGEWNEVANARR